MPSQRVMVHVIEDDSSFRRSIERLLRAVGYDVEAFASADQYLASGSGNACLVLDMHMPGRSGLDLIDDLARRGQHPRVVFVTADDTPGVIERARKAGAVAFLGKPVPASDLLRAIERASAASCADDRTAADPGSPRAEDDDPPH